MIDYLELTTLGSEPSYRIAAIGADAVSRDVRIDSSLDIDTSPLFLGDIWEVM